MCQERVLKYLEDKKGRWIDTKELSSALGQTLGSTQSNLKKLIHGKFVERKITSDYKFYYRVLAE